MTQAGTLPSTPAAEVDINERLLRRLLRQHCPELVSEPLHIMDAGWDNVMVRVGKDYALRLPRRAVAEPLIRNEQKWLPWLAPQLPLKVPVPIQIGTPTKDYPFHWSLQKWLPGQPADLAPPRPDQADILARFLLALHGLTVPTPAPRNPLRDGHLSVKAKDTEKRMAELKLITDAITPAVITAWQDALSLPFPDKRSFIAGDMHARNVLTKEGAITAIIDWGDMCLGDPAVDVMSVWALFDDPSAREKVLDIYGADKTLVARAKGWAVFSGVILLHTGLQDTPRHAKMGRDVLRRMTEDA